MKDNFLLKKSQEEVFKELSDEDAGKLIKGIFEYVNTGKNSLDGYLKIIFVPIKNEIEKNEERYKKICERNKQNGLLGGRPKSEEEKNPVGYLGNKKNPKKPIYHNHIHNHLEDKRKSNRGTGEEKKKKETFIDTDDDGLLSEISKKVIGYLNEIVGTKYRSSSKSTQSKIKARLNEGYRLDDFIVVVDKKYKEWKNTEFEQYLCPDTLFGNKFEKYLNQKINMTKKNEKLTQYEKNKEVLKNYFGGKTE